MGLFKKLKKLVKKTGKLGGGILKKVGQAGKGIPVFGKAIKLAGDASSALYTGHVKKAGKLIIKKGLGAAADVGLGLSTGGLSGVLGSAGGFLGKVGGVLHDAEGFVGQAQDLFGQAEGAFGGGPGGGGGAPDGGPALPSPSSSSNPDGAPSMMPVLLVGGALVLGAVLLSKRSPS